MNATPSSPRLDFKWGTAPPLLDESGNPVRAFGLASAEIIHPARWEMALQTAGLAAAEEALPLLRQQITQSMQAILPQFTGDLLEFSRAVLAQAAPRFEDLGLSLTSLEIQSVEDAATAAEAAFRDPAPPPQPFPTLSLGTFGLTYPVDDIRLTPPENPDES